MNEPGVNISMLTFNIENCLTLAYQYCVALSCNVIRVHIYVRIAHNGLLVVNHPLRSCFNSNCCRFAALPAYISLLVIMSPIKEAISVSNEH